MKLITLFTALLFFSKGASAQAPPGDTLRIRAETNSAVSIQLASGIGASPLQIGNILWNAEVMFALPDLSDHSRLWLGIIPTMDPQATGDENAADGFVPIAIEYECDFSGTSTTPFLYANAGAGPQFGDRSKHQLFQAVMSSAGVGIHNGKTAGFVGKFGLTYNTVLQNSRVYLIFDVGIAF